MSQWRIQPGAVQGVLGKVAAAQEQLAGSVSEQAVTASFEGLTWGSAITQDVQIALSALLEEQQANLQAIGNRVGAGIAGVGNATVAYQYGQEDMCGTFQAQIPHAAETGDFSYFDAHGYEG